MDEDEEGKGQMVLIVALACAALVVSIASLVFAVYVGQ